MTGVLPGSGHNAGRLVRFGYAAMTASPTVCFSTLEKRCPSMNFTTGIPPRMVQTFLCAKLKKAVGMRLQAQICTPVSRIFTGLALPCPAALCRRHSTFETQRMTK